MKSLLVVLSLSLFLPPFLRTYCIYEIGEFIDDLIRTHNVKFIRIKNFLMSDVSRLDGIF